jgi:hypothetical protein
VAQRAGFRVAVARALLFSVLAVACAPGGYCDLCSYRDLPSVAASSAAPSPPSPRAGGCGCSPGSGACGDPAAPERDTEGKAKEGGKALPMGVGHARVPYCLSSTLASLLRPVELPGEGVRRGAPAEYEGPAPSGPRSCWLPRHAESRAPPVS